MPWAFEISQQREFFVDHGGAKPSLESRLFACRSLPFMHVVNCTILRRTMLTTFAFPQSSENSLIRPERASRHRPPSLCDTGTNLLPNEREYIGHIHARTVAGAPDGSNARAGDLPLR